MGGSPSSRRAWIEIFSACSMRSSTSVALLAEGVDRNCPVLLDVVTTGVALLAEGVDRNWLSMNFFASLTLSPSSRRAWIEIGNLFFHSQRVDVALLAEGVDRNLQKRRNFAF